MDNRYGVLTALLAARLGRVAESTLRQAAAEAVPPGDVRWPDFLIDIGAIRPDEAAALEALAIDLLQVCGGDLHRAASMLQGGALLEMLSGLPPVTPSPHDTTGAGLTAPMHQGHKEWLEVEQAVLPETPGRYRHISQHGKGGMGRVLLVHDASLGRDIALKELLSDLETGSTGPDTPLRKSTEVTARFLQEAFVTARLEHPNIVPVYEVGRRPAGNLFYTMRLVRGKTLGQAIGAAKTMQERLALIPNFLSLCHAIAYAHSRKVIHRDIKPSNIMVGEFGETVVLDWGVAKVKDATDPFGESIRSTPEDVKESPGAWLETEYGTAVGTPQYMSPEQALGQLDEVDERSDVYALGVVLYEILAGVPPYKAKSLHALLLDVSRGGCTPLSETAPEAPPELASICARAMNKSRDMRYRSAAALADEVERWQAGLLVRAYEYRFPELVKRYYEKHRPLVQTIGAAVGVIVGVLVFSYWSIWNARDREREERIAAEKNGYRSQMLLAQSHVEGRRFGSAQSELENTLQPLRHIEWGLLAAQCAQDATRLDFGRPLLESHIAGEAGDLVLTRDIDGAIRLSRTDGELLETWQFPALGVRSIEISPDGRFAAVAVTDGTVHRLTLQAGGEDRSEGGGAIVNHAVFSPDGAEIAACGEDGIVRFMDAATLEERARWRTRDNLLRVRYSPAGGSVLLWSDARIISLRDRETGNETYQFAGERPEWSADGRAIAFRDGNEGGIALPDEQRIVRLIGHTDIVRHTVIAPDGARALSVSNDDTARVWDARTGELLRVLVVGANAGTCAITPDGTAAAFWTEENYLRLYALNEESEPRDYTGHAAGMAPGKLSSDGTHALTCSMDGTARLWDISRPAVYHPLLPVSRDVVSAFLGEDTGLFGAVQWNGPLVLASADTGAPLGGMRVRGPIFGNAAATGRLGKKITASLDAFAPMVLEPAGKMSGFAATRAVGRAGRGDGRIGALRGHRPLGRSRFHLEHRDRRAPGPVGRSGRHGRRRILWARWRAGCREQLPRRYRALGLAGGPR
jgi:serine/threonine protein kinase/WD40 repeat protein